MAEKTELYLEKTRLLFEHVIPRRENWWREVNGLNPFSR